MGKKTVGGGGRKRTVPFTNNKLSMPSKLDHHHQEEEGVGETYLQSQGFLSFIFGKMKGGGRGQYFASRERGSDDEGACLCVASVVPYSST